MSRFFVLVGNELKPVDIARITDERDFSDEKLDSGLKKAVLDTSDHNSIEDFAISGEPLAISAGVPGGGHHNHYKFSGVRLVDRLRATEEGYDKDVIFVIGNHGINFSSLYKPTFPVVPLKNEVQTGLVGVFGEVEQAIFKYDPDTGKVISVNPLAGDLTPLRARVIEGGLHLYRPGEEGKAIWSGSFAEAGIHLPEDHPYLNNIFTDGREPLIIALTRLELLEAPLIYGAYGNAAASTHQDSTFINDIQNFLRFAQTGLTGDKDGKFPLERIVRVIGKFTGDTFYTTFPVAMMGYRMK